MRKLSEALRLTGYGFGYIKRATPGYLFCQLLSSFCEALQPITVLFFSSNVLDELIGQRRTASLVLYAGLTISITFFMSVLKALADRKTKLCLEVAYQRLGIIQAECYLSMDYPHAENADLSQKRAQMNTLAHGNGLGIMNLYWLMPHFLTHALSLVFSLALLSGMFASQAGYEKNIATSSAGTFILAALFIAALAANAFYLSKEPMQLQKVYAENAKGNTTAQYYNKYIRAGMAAKDIRLYNQRPALEEIFKKKYSVKEWLGFFFFQARLQGFTKMSLSLVSGASYLLIGLRALYGMYGVGSVVRYVGAVTAFVGALATVVYMAGRLINNAEYIKPYKDFDSLPELIKKGSLPVQSAAEHVHQFEFKNVSFRYPGAESFALKNLNLKLDSNKRLAVVGLNGSGKTTMIKLLCRLYDPDEGEILLDGVNIKEYDYEQYHTLFSVVFQDFKLFALKISENVSSSNSPDNDKVQKMLDLAGFGGKYAIDQTLYKDIDEENGVTVSGGEAQKIALARALYKDAPIVILDEPTAALDPIAEFEVYSTFDKTLGNKTAVFISHRLSSCRFCHDIAVFENGELIQRGNHETLLANETGRYYELWHAQAKHYNKGNAE